MRAAKMGAEGDILLAVMSLPKILIFGEIMMA
jgi:hypothetical protein